MSLNQSLQQKLLQKLSPQQIQLMKLLQVPTAILEERIKEEMEENPALELSEEGHDDSFDEGKDEFAEQPARRVMKPTAAKTLTKILTFPIMCRKAMTTLPTIKCAMKITATRKKSK